MRFQRDPCRERPSQHPSDDICAQRLGTLCARGAIRNNETKFRAINWGNCSFFGALCIAAKVALHKTENAQTETLGRTDRESWAAAELARAQRPALEASGRGPRDKI